MAGKALNIFESKNGFKTMFDHATIGILVVSKRGVIELANSFAEKMFGHEITTLAGQLLESLIPDNLKKMHTEHHAGYFNHPKERKMGGKSILFAKRKNGTLFPVEISLGHFDIDGEVFALTYITDITERYQNEEALRSSEEKYRYVFDNSLDVRAIYEVVFDDNQNVIDLIIKEANPFYQEVLRLGGLKHDYVGHRLSEIPDDYSKHFLECKEAMLTRKPRTFPHFNPISGWYLMVNIVPMENNHCFVFGIDISLLENSEYELNLLNKELEHRVEERTESLASAINELAQSRNELVKALSKEKELNELKSRFVTTASHEFRTPLATILSSASIIEKYVETEEQEKRKKHIERIQSSVNWKFRPNRPHLTA